MPRFYFHLYDDIQTLDEEGRAYPAFEAALTAAFVAARALAAEQVAREGRVVASHRIDLADERQRVLDSVYFGDAVVLVGETPPRRQASRLAPHAQSPYALR
jgi:hypothetical protein